MALTTLQSNGWVYTSGRWQKNINGYVRKLILSLVVSNDNIDRVNAALNIKNQLGEIGIEVNVVRVAPEKYAEYLKYPITFTDEMCKGLELNEGAKIYYGASDTTGEALTFASEGIYKLNT